MIVLGEPVQDLAVLVFGAGLRAPGVAHMDGESGFRPVDPADQGFVDGVVGRRVVGGVAHSDEAEGLGLGRAGGQGESGADGAGQLENAHAALPRIRLVWGEPAESLTEAGAPPYPVHCGFRFSVQAFTPSL
jgi:hypothetical protein